MLGTSPAVTVAQPPASLGDDEWFAAWRAQELSRVDRSRLTYLDYTGAALYPESLVRSDCERLQQTVLGNPHSEHVPSRSATGDAERAREAILSFLNADPNEYACVLTGNATHGCRLVAESFPFASGGRLLLSADNHNSVNGIREFARRSGATVATVGLDSELRPIPTYPDAIGRPSLFAFPAQSNFSGVRHPLGLIDAAQRRGWRVLLDAASYLPTADLDLRSISPDFVVLSLYKIIGYPTGLGALVARHDALGELRRPSFAGGTVHWVSVQHQLHHLLPGASGFEDGTLPFTALGAVAPALEAAAHSGRERLARHLKTLTAELLDALASLRHRNGSPVVVLHGPSSVADRGATVAITLRRSNGTIIPYWEAESHAREWGIAVRGGCFCNPGSAEAAFKFSPDATGACLRALGSDFSVPRFAECLGGGPVGALRISLGLGSVRADITRVSIWLRTYVDQ